MRLCDSPVTTSDKDEFAVQIWNILLWRKYLPPGEDGWNHMGNVGADRSERVPKTVPQ